MHLKRLRSQTGLITPVNRPANHPKSFTQTLTLMWIRWEMACTLSRWDWGQTFPASSYVGNNNLCISQGCTETVLKLFRPSSKDQLQVREGPGDEICIELHGETSQDPKQVIPKVVEGDQQRVWPYHQGRWRGTGTINSPANHYYNKWNPKQLGNPAPWNNQQNTVMWREGKPVRQY